MTHAAPNTDPYSSQELDKRVRLYAEMGFGAERTVVQLCRFGFPHALIAERFPDVPATAYVSTAQPARKTTHKPARPTAGWPAAKLAETAPAQLVLEHLTQRRALPSPKPRAASTVRAICAAPDAAATPTTPDAISFQYVPLIQCSFPHTDPGEATSFTRRNGWLELTLSTARPETGLPYGVPARLLTIYCASEAIRTKSPEIYLGHTVQDFLRRLDVPITRGERGSLRVYANQMMRLVGCALSIDEDITDNKGRTGLHIRQAHFVEEARLWWDQDGIDDGSSLVLSHSLFESILERSAPLSTNAIKQLRKSPMDLDVYAWLVHRLFTMSKPSTIRWDQLSGQFGHNYAETRNFRQYFLASLKRVTAVYPEAKVNVSPHGLTLLPSKSHVPRASISVPR